MIWVLSLFGLYLVLLFAVAWVSLHPFRSPIFFSPGSLGFDQEEVAFSNPSGQTLRGWWMESKGCDCVAVLAHGYMMNRCELAPLACWLSQRGCAALVFDFRAHGKSMGRKSGLGWPEKEDIKAAVAFARTRRPQTRVLLVGSSMGASACAFALAEDPALADLLILDSAYSRMQQAVSGWWRFLGGKWLSLILSPTVLIAAPIAGFNPFRVDVSLAVAKIKAPVLFVHGTSDNLATPEEAKRNLAACSGPADILWFEGCGHSEGRWVYPNRFYEAISSFLCKNGFIEGDQSSRPLGTSVAAGSEPRSFDNRT